MTTETTLPPFQPTTEPATTPPPPAPAPAEPPPGQKPPTNKGGRPKGSKNKKPGQAPPPPGPTTPTQTTADEELAKLAAEYRAPAAAPGAPQAQPGQPQQPATPPPGQTFVITGHLALVIVDTFIPSAMSWILKRYGWEEVSADQLKLTDKERQDLEPIMDAVVKQLMADPWVILVLGLVGAYAGKIPPKSKKKKS